MMTELVMHLILGVSGIHGNISFLQAKQIIVCLLGGVLVFGIHGNISCELDE